MKGDGGSEFGLRRLEDWWGFHLSKAAGLYIVKGLGLMVSIFVPVFLFCNLRTHLHEASIFHRAQNWNPVC